MDEKAHPDFSDQQLVTALCAKDPQALGRLYDRYAPALFGMIQGIVKEELSAETVLQTCFIQIWERISEYDPAHASLFIWLVRIIRPCAAEKMKERQAADAPPYRAGEENAAFRMAWANGYSCGETAAGLGISEAAVRTSIRKTIQDLQLTNI